MTFLASLTAGDFATAQQQLLPRGRAWPRRAGTVIQAVSQALGDCLYQLHAAGVAFLETESFPATAYYLLPDFEADYGLPDVCSPAPSTVLQRRGALMAKIASSPGSQTKAYFIGVAAALGYAITITTWDVFTPGAGAVIPYGGSTAIVSTDWRFAWQVNAPTITVHRFTPGASALPEPMWSIGNTELQCRIRKLAPSYGVLWFAYGPVTTAALDDFVLDESALG
jgi:uncharacterized protein YmfQ (DUF2313 family)